MSGALARVDPALEYFLDDARVVEERPSTRARSGASTRSHAPVAKQPKFRVLVGNPSTPLRAARSSRPIQREPGVNYLSPTQVGERLGFVAEVIRRWCRAGKLLGHKLPNGQWRIHPQCVEDYLDQSASSHGTANRITIARSIIDAAVRGVEWA